MQLCCAELFHTTPHFLYTSWYFHTCFSSDRFMYPQPAPTNLLLICIHGLHQKRMRYSRCFSFRCGEERIPWFSPHCSGSSSRSHRYCFLPFLRRLHHPVSFCGVGTCAVAHDVYRWTQHAYAFRQEGVGRVPSSYSSSRTGYDFAKLRWNGSSLVWYYVSFPAAFVDIVSDSVRSLPGRVADYYSKPRARGGFFLHSHRSPRLLVPADCGS